MKHPIWNTLLLISQFVIYNIVSAQTGNFSDVWTGAVHFTNPSGSTPIGFEVWSNTINFRYQGGYFGTLNATNGTLTLNGDVNAGGANWSGYYARANGAVATLRITDPTSYGSVYGFVGTDTNTPFMIRANAQPVMWFSTSGNVGIGTGSPAQKLDIAGNLLLSGGRSVIMTTGDNATTHRGGFQFITCDNGVTNVLTPTDQNGSPRNGQIRLGGFNVFNNNVVDFVVSGNVGIGTTNPTQKLSVNGTIRAKEVMVEASPWVLRVF